MSADRVAEFLKDRARSLNLSQTELSRRSNLSRQTLYRLFSADISQAKISTIVKVSRALQVEPTDVMGIYFGRSIKTGSTIH
ncbi:MAG: Unknown protein [uncultured Thiotrichaceae bacterium]|uniref:HTH cro/C1-type domain-containing protein n=1 Tax=uncultured Thiotrichaceae bacterium TaxID=298394 RepID=A0A6S6U896_9GAMM|nr:MAG: Unknown protein [uncultured Thiotrichaceae bacterium]